MVLTTEELQGLLEKATPGPWSDKGTDFETVTVDTETENAVAYIGRPQKRPIACVIVYSSFGMDWRLNANARLIAAAPDLAKDRIRLEAENAALRAEVERLREALEPFATCLSRYTFPEHQIILLSEDNPKGRRLTHLLPENFYRARAALGKGGE